MLDVEGGKLKMKNEKIKVSGPAVGILKWVRAQPFRNFAFIILHFAFKMGYGAQPHPKLFFFLFYLFIFIP